MKPAPKKGWWYRATKAQRLAQLDGGIECGMSAPQIAMNCGCLTTQKAHRGKVVSHFATHNSRKFGPMEVVAPKARNATRAFARVRIAKIKGDLTDTHFNIFDLDKPAPTEKDRPELRF